MFAGFDFGTSNCAVGVMGDNATVRLLPINQGEAFMPSALYSLERELISEFVALHINDKARQDAYMEERAVELASARRVRIREDIPASEQTVFVGQEAVEQYLSFPGDGYFIKSIKSFLGATDLRPQTVHFFQDIVTAKMQQIKTRAEQALGTSIEHTVIGRPVNFQGLNAQESNRSAIDILTTAAHRAGFRSVEFFYEPLAAGLDFEAQLTTNKTVLIVDVGGGTSDCAMVRMGPDYIDKKDRTADFLGHSGRRIGGNDFDIQLAGVSLMPLFGMRSTQKNGLPMPTQVFWNAVATNNVGAQVVFNSAQTERSLQQYLIDSCEPALIKRFIAMRERKQNHRLVRSAEQGKIALSSDESCEVDLSYIEAELATQVNREQFASAINRLIPKMMELIDEAITQAGCQPDCVYVTGGAAKSRVIRAAVEQRMGDIEVIDGDHFGSVAKGLTHWAKRLFA